MIVWTKRIDNALANHQTYPVSDVKKGAIFVTESFVQVPLDIISIRVIPNPEDTRIRSYDMVQSMSVFLDWLDERTAIGGDFFSPKKQIFTVLVNGYN